MGQQTEGRTALVFGASGLVGKELVKELLSQEAYQHVRTFGRSTLDLSHSKLEQKVIDFSQPEQFQKFVTGDDIFLALGTTMAKAGSKEVFYKVDFTYTVEAAKFAVANGIQQVLLVSSVGADPNSRVFYSKVKGEIEKALEGLGFETHHIFRPSVLLGDRNESRPLEAFAQLLSKGFNWAFGSLMGKYQPVPGKVVARAMVHSALSGQKGIFIHPSHQIHKLSSSL